MFRLCLFVSILCGIKASNYVWQQENIHSEAIDTEKAWISWKEYFSKQYVTIEEELKRHKIWGQNWQKIMKSNSNSSITHKLRMNQFGDMTATEFDTWIKESNNIIYPTIDATVDEDDNTYHDTSSYSDIPTSIDWTNYQGKNYVTPVKSQDICTNTVAFINSISSVWAVNTSMLYNLSQLEVSQCTSTLCNEQGILFQSVFPEIARNYTTGICDESEYNSLAQCKKNECTGHDPILGAINVKSKSSSDLATAVATNGPTVVGIEADQDVFQFYESGVITGNCGTRIDHSLLVVGYGTDESGTEYWKCQNSWGTDWGQKGYVLICKDCDKNNGYGECGILSSPIYPKISQ